MDEEKIKTIATFRKWARIYLLLKELGNGWIRSSEAYKKLKDKLNISYRAFYYHLQQLKRKDLLETKKIESMLFIKVK